MVWKVTVRVATLPDPNSTQARTERENVGNCKKIRIRVAMVDSLPISSGLAAIALANIYGTGWAVDTFAQAIRGRRRGVAVSGNKTATKPYTENSKKREREKEKGKKLMSLIIV